MEESSSKESIMSLFNPFTTKVESSDDDNYVSKFGANSSIKIPDEEAQELGWKAGSTHVIHEVVGEGKLLLTGLSAKQLQEYEDAQMDRAAAHHAKKLKGR